MSEYQLHCFAQSGNAYRAALMLNLIRADWEPVFVDFFGKMVQRTPEWRGEVNEMGEAPVLVHGERTLSQSGVILTYLSETTGLYHTKTEDDRLEALRWLLFDNQKVNGYIGPYRFLRWIVKPPADQKILDFLKGRIDNSMGVVEKRLAKGPWLVADYPTIADISMCGYMYYPAEELGFDIPETYPNIGKWLERIKTLPGWKHPYDLMPGHPLPGR